ncbi:hypothetical protein D3C87_2057910 [compost metagenome]
MLIEEPCYVMARNVLVTLGAMPTAIQCDEEGLETSSFLILLAMRLPASRRSTSFPWEEFLSVGRRRQPVD